MPSKSPLAGLFNCEDLSDGVLEVIEKSNHYKPKLYNSNAVRQAKKPKLEEAKTTILSIHSLLFSSNSEYFRKLMVSTSPPYRIKVFIEPNETDHFLDLVRLLYDSSFIEQMAVTNSVRTLGLAVQFSCGVICEQLLRHISCCMLETIDVVNQSIKTYYEFINNENEAISNAVDKIKLACVKYLKKEFCPCEKISGCLLQKFLKLPYSSILFFLEYIETAISVTENTVIALVLHWSACNSSVIKDDDSKLFALINICRFTDVSDVSFLLDVAPLDHPILSGCEWYPKFYIKILEYFLSANLFCYPEFPQKVKRQINFAYDHDLFLYFQLCREEPKNSLKREFLADDPYILRFELETCEKNDVFVKGYQISLSAIIQNENENKDKKLQIKLSVENFARTRHSNLCFFMLYSIASPSISDTFSPWSYCKFNVPSDSSCSYATISQIAQHSLIVNTGFYLRCYLE